jgi:Transposase DDE domain
MEPAPINLKHLPQTLGTVTDLLADNGYFSENNVRLCEENKVASYIAVKRDSHHPPLMKRFQELASLPDEANAVDAMKHRLKTKAAKAVYATRKSTIEPVFGIIKSVMGFRQFLLRGLDAVRGEWNLVCIAFNLKRLYDLAK